MSQTNKINKVLRYLEHQADSMAYTLNRALWGYDGKNQDVEDLKWYAEGYNFYRNEVLKLEPPIYVLLKDESRQATE